MRGFWIAGLLLLGVGCENEMSCDELASISPGVEIGQGERRFMALEEGDSVERHWGTQGGSHVYFAVKATGLNPGKEMADAPKISISVIDDDGLEVAFGENGFEPFRGSGRESELSGITSVHSLLDWSEYEDYLEEKGLDGEAGFPATVRLEVQDSCGTVVEDERRVYFSLF